MDSKDKEIPGLLNCIMELASCQNQFVAILVKTHNLCKEHGLLLDLKLGEKPIPLGEGGDLVTSMMPETGATTFPMTLLPPDYLDPAKRPDITPKLAEALAKVEQLSQDNEVLVRRIFTDMNYQALPGNDAIALEAVLTREQTPAPTNWQEFDRRQRDAEAFAGDDNQDRRQPSKDDPTPTDESVAFPTEIVEEKPVFNYVGDQLADLLRAWLPEETINHGTGTYRGLKRFQEDVRQVPETVLMRWPTGIYHDAQDKSEQLLLNVAMDNKGCCLVVIPRVFYTGTPDTVSASIVWRGPEGDMRYINDETPPDLREALIPYYKALIERYMQNLV